MLKPGRLEVHLPIDLEATLMGGQAFRWMPVGDGWYSGVIQDCLVNVRVADGGIEYRSNWDEGQVRPLLESYFRLDDDIDAIRAELSRDATIAQLIQKYPGLRLLRQDPWECLVAYLCSANNSIQQISNICERLSKEFGRELTLGAECRNTFPTSADLASVALPELRNLKLGLERADNIHGLAMEVEGGALDLWSLRNADAHEARERLLRYRGVGEKIAGCVLLFSLDKLDAFPIDRHIGRALVSAYFPHLKETQLKKLETHSKEKFKDYAGIAGQLLFHEIKFGSSLATPQRSNYYFY